MYEAAGPSITDTVAVAHARNVAVVVDAAIAFPPPENLRRFIAAGVDLVAFSAGKDLRGPQTAGFLAGRADLIRSVALQQQDFAANDGQWDREAALLSPGHGLGRPMKVGREELVGALVALRLYPTRDHAGELAAQQRAVATIAAAAAEYPQVRVETGQAQTPGHFVRLWFPDDARAQRLFDALGAGGDGVPRILAGKSALNPPATVMIGSATLQPGEAEVIAERLHTLLAEDAAQHG
jgi:L-seryl-tRNA(Ser) seleniumtransferase